MKLNNENREVFPILYVCSASTVLYFAKTSTMIPFLSEVVCDGDKKSAVDAFSDFYTSADGRWIFTFKKNCCYPSGPCTWPKKNSFITTVVRGKCNCNSKIFSSINVELQLSWRVFTREQIRKFVDCLPKHDFSGVP